jgi:hypothetical protein
MISLKRNDKIIIIVAIVILVLAAVGVAMYQSPKPTVIPRSGSTSEKTFKIIWTERNGSLDTISEFVSKKTKFETSVKISEWNLQSVTFNLSWIDDKMTFMKRRGLDRFTFEVTTPDAYTFTEIKTSAPITGQGNITYTKNIGVIPPQSTIIAPDEADAKALLSKKTSTYYDSSWYDKDIKINISVKVGESPIRILRYLLDQGNNFDLKITYTYLDGSLGEEITKSTGEDLTPPPDDFEETPPYISMIIGTGCGRYI